jgi:acyl homoserine lactone synthase
MHNVTFDLSRLQNHGAAFWDYLRLRKHHFVDTLHWDIPHNHEFEMDQYDNPTAHYSLVLKNGKVVGGARTMPTTAKWGKHSYMLKDAFDGKLEDIPAEVMPDRVVSDRVWECTRLVISDELDNHIERGYCLQLIVDGLVRTANMHGGAELMSLSPVSLMRALRQLGYDAYRVGEPYRNFGDGRTYAVLGMPAQPVMALMAAE